ncbi:MAG TPA: transglycosylase SLT domain-containing protein [Longimicrobiales bacterium]|nr:transglycosylase SLT domain-containing protein [Longimicrobiales bacterium]
MRRFALNRRDGVLLATGAALAVAGFGVAIPERESAGPAAELAGLGEATPLAGSGTTEVTAGLGPEWDLPNLDHARVDYWIARFDSVPDMREKFQGFLDRGGEYAPMILAALEERDMPRDLLYLAMIESGFQPHATSHAAAVGLWQFIRETGERYGLDVDRAVDERRDPVRATEAALDYLEELHDRFDSWYLAAAAYNSGENRVSRAMRAQFGRERARSEADYYAIWDRLPKETRDYVPLMIAAGRITKDAETYGFRPMTLESRSWDEVTVPPATQLSAIAATYGTTVQTLKELNPQFKLERTPNNRQYTVRVPEGSAARFAQAGAASGTTSTAD